MNLIDVVISPTPFAPLELEQIWNHAGMYGGIPAIYVPRRRGRVLVKAPLTHDIDNWVRVGKRKRLAAFDDRSNTYGIPRSWLDLVIRETVRRCGRTFLIREFNRVETCARKCWEAKGWDCSCSCMGHKHGSFDDEGWWELSATFAVRSSRLDLACSLVTMRTISEYGLDSRNGEH